MNLLRKEAKAEKLNKIIELEKEQLKLMDEDIFAIDENGWTNNEKWWKLNDEIKGLELKEAVLDNWKSCWNSRLVDECFGNPAHKCSFCEHYSNDEILEILKK